MTRYLALAGVPLAALALFATGCGGKKSTTTTTSTRTTSPGTTVTGTGTGTATDTGEKTSATEWAGAFCTASMTWSVSLVRGINSLRSGDVSAEAVQGVADDVKSSTETFVDDLHGLGRPDTAAGQKAQKTLDRLADDLRNEINQVEKLVNNPAERPLSKIIKATSLFGTMAKQLNAAFSKLQQLDAKGELQDAFKKASACDSLTS